MSEGNPALMVPLNALIEQARAEKKWLWCYYQDLWFSPDELTAQNAEGRFRWGIVNWKLRDPVEMLQEAEQCAAKANAEVEGVRSRITQETT